MNQLSLVIPVFNGEKYLPQTFQELASFFVNKEYLGEIIFVDDGSTDATSDLISNFILSNALEHIQIVHVKENSGKGKAVKLGISVANPLCEYIGFTDVELPYGLEKVGEAIEYFQKHTETDIIIGKRMTQEQYSPYRKFFKALFRVFLPSSVRHIVDTQCGFKFFRAPVARSLFTDIVTDRWVFDVELLVHAVRKNCHVYELPVEIKKSCVTPRGGVTLLRHGPSIVRDLLKVTLKE
jgi:glycosyltransferase involved in cell wall biosynthesis